MAKKESAEKAVREIRRQTRRRFPAEERIRIVIEGLRGAASGSWLLKLAAGPSETAFWRSLAVAALDATGDSSCAYEERASDVIVPCPQCKDRFQLEDRSISGSGKLIRCPSCSHAFVVKSADEREVASGAGAGIRAPAVKAVEELVIGPHTVLREHHPISRSRDEKRRASLPVAHVNFKLHKVLLIAGHDAVG